VCARVLQWVGLETLKIPAAPCLQRSEASLAAPPDPRVLAYFTKVSFATRAAAVPSWSFPCCAGGDQNDCQQGRHAKTDHRRR